MLFFVWSFTSLHWEIPSLSCRFIGPHKQCDTTLVDMWDKQPLWWVALIGSPGGCLWLRAISTQASAPAARPPARYTRPAHAEISVACVKQQLPYQSVCVCVCIMVSQQIWQAVKVRWSRVFKFQWESYRVCYSIKNVTCPLNPKLLSGSVS